MDDLIAALQIFRKYLANKNAHSVTHCEHDIMYVVDVKRGQVSDEDHAQLEKLGFIWSQDGDPDESMTNGSYISFRFGSA